MKKIILFLVLLLICGCHKEEKHIFELPNTNEKEEVEEIEEPVYIDDNPIKIAFYKKENGIYKILNKYSSHVEKLKEIGIFSIILSDMEEVSGDSIKSLFKEMSSNISNFSNYKIGFNVKFTLIDGRVINTNVFKPVEYTNYGFSPYLYAWIYDDVNANGWHSHIEEKDFNENTIMSSIKLMWGNESNLINSDVELTVFTYDSDDFDKDGNYIGISKFTTIIERK